MSEVVKPVNLFVAYRTRRVPDLAPDLASLQPPANYKNEDVILKWHQEQAAKADAVCLTLPYLATFDEVIIALTHDDGRHGRWTYRDPVSSGKPPVSSAVRDWLMTKFPDAWENSLFPSRSGAPQAVFIGFEPKLFLKILGVECSLPGNAIKTASGTPDGVNLTTLPLSAWIGNSDHRDMTDLMTMGEKFLTWPLVLKARGLDTPEFRDWPGPGVNPGLDIKLLLHLAGQIGLWA